MTDMSKKEITVYLYEGGDDNKEIVDIFLKYEGEKDRRPNYIEALEELFDEIDRNEMSVEELVEEILQTLRRV